MSKKTVTVEGRECESVKLSNGDTAFIVIKLKGREYLEVRRATTKMLELRTDMKTMQKQKGEQNFDVTSNLSVYIDVIEANFSSLVTKIEDSEGKEKTSNIEYFYELEVEDADLVYEKLSDLMEVTTKTADSKKK